MAAKKVALKYSGKADTRVIRKKDMEAMGLPSESDFSQVKFQRDTPTEVSGEAAEILLAHDFVKGQFAKHEPKVEATADTPTAADSPVKK